MLTRSLKILAGLSLIPVCIGFTWQLFSMALAARYRPLTPYFFTGGVLAYVAAHLLFRKPVMTYVIGHELTHALFALLFGGSVTSFQASTRGGRVTVTRSNFIITLAPYFFPLYSFIALVLYGAARAADIDPIVPHIMVLLSGAAFAFHLVLTFVFLRTDQKDIQEQGAVFSYPLIYLFNVCFAALLFKVCLAESFDYLTFFADGIMRSAVIVLQLFRTAWSFAQRITA